MEIKKETPTKAIKIMKPKAVKKDDSVNALIAQAIGANVPVETLERLFALRKEVKAEQAKEAFVTSLAGFQADIKTIEKKKPVMNKDGKTVRYYFAPIDSIVDQIKTALGKYGFSYTWNVQNDVGFVTAICTITHEFGHSQTSEFKVPIDPEGYMTAPQKVASALTFAKRYSLCNALGISTGDEDTDATDVNKEKSAKSDKSKIIFLLKALGHEKSTATKEGVTDIVAKLTSLTPEDKNLGEIVTRLEILVKEKEEYANPDIR